MTIQTQIPRIVAKIDGILEAQGLYNDFQYTTSTGGTRNIRTQRITGAVSTVHTFKGVITNTGSSVYRNGERFTSSGHEVLMELSVIPTTTGEIKSVASNSDNSVAKNNFKPSIGQSYAQVLGTAPGDNINWYILEIAVAPQNGIFDILLGRS